MSARSNITTLRFQITKSESYSSHRRPCSDPPADGLARRRAVNGLSWRSDGVCRVSRIAIFPA
jgi:hypothetical protein